MGWGSGGEVGMDACVDRKMPQCMRNSLGYANFRENYVLRVSIKQTNNTALSSEVCSTRMNLTMADYSHSPQFLQWAQGRQLLWRGVQQEPGFWWV